MAKKLPKLPGKLLFLIFIIVLLVILFIFLKVLFFVVLFVILAVAFGLWLYKFLSDKKKQVEGEAKN
jgi:membrane protein implicated in regulation of membrane protease activity